MGTEYSDTWQTVTGSVQNGYTLNGSVRFDYLFRSVHRPESDDADQLLGAVDEPLRPLAGHRGLQHSVAQRPAPSFCNALTNR